MREINEIPAEKFRFVPASLSEGGDPQGRRECPSSDGSLPQPSPQGGGQDLSPSLREVAEQCEVGGSAPSTSGHAPSQPVRLPAPSKREPRARREEKPSGYFREAFGRFRKNKSSVVAAVIILCLVAYAVFVPIFCQTSYSRALTDTTYLQYTKLKPKLFDKLNFWDGCSVKTLGRGNYLYLQAIAEETGYPVIKKVLSEGENRYKCRVDSYTAKGFAYMTLSAAEYQSIQTWQLDKGVQVLYPAVTDQSLTDANIWYKANKKGVPLLENGSYVNQYKTSGNDGNYTSLRIAGDDGSYRYATVTGDGSSYRCRVFLYTYFQYRYGYEPAFLLGTTGQGQDILTRLASAARFSLVFALCVSAVNLLIGGVYGAIEGYYGGTADLLMERITDILSRIPFLVVATLFQLHLAAKVGPILSLLFAFVLTGWIGIADITRMQFYRYKNREYVQAARILGAGDGRIMFRHIFPNALGTIITGSVLVIPGVIFLESSLTYLGIVNLDSSQMTSVGTMLANGRQYLSTDPHIIFFPALFISLLEISFNLFGNGLRDAFNPTLRGADR